ncbi:hypothetical protein ACFL1B_04295 [Nanoarchaeota archaeon]
MYLEELFEKYAEWKILVHFLKYPQSELHVKEVARQLQVSPGTASKTLNKAAKDNLLNKRIIGNIHLYSLNKKDKRMRNLRRLVQP